MTPSDLRQKEAQQLKEGLLQAAASPAGAERATDLDNPWRDDVATD